MLASPVGSSGCFISQSGRRLRTTGIVAKFSGGGGEVVAHSSVKASHGSLAALAFVKPIVLIQFTMKTITPRARVNAPMVEIRFSSSQPRFGAIGVLPSWHAQQAHDVHREERQIQPNEEEPELELAQPFIEQRPENFGYQ